VNSIGSGAENQIVPDVVNPDSSTIRRQFKIGDEITIQLTTVNASEVSFILNDRNFGSLNVGDEVEIYDERKVTVNGALRLPKSPN
jgi:hypothetical protein